jgi:hypothetical protein
MPRLIAVLVLAGVGVSVAQGAADAVTNEQHIVNPGHSISFYAPSGFVHQNIARFYEISDYNRNLGVQILIQNPAGAVSITDGHSYLTNWLGKTDLTFGASKYVHKKFGRVAVIAFSNLPTSYPYRLYGRDLRFTDGLRSYDVVVDSPNPVDELRTASMLLSTWGT